MQMQNQIKAEVVTEIQTCSRLAWSYYKYTNSQIRKKYGIKVTDLLPVFLQAGLAGEVAGVMHGLQLPEDPAAGKNVHPAQAHFHFLFLCSSQTSCQLHSPSCSCSLLSAHHCRSTFRLGVSLPTEVRQSRSRSAARHTGPFPPIRGQLSNSDKRRSRVSAPLIGAQQPGAVTCHVPQASGQRTQLHDITPFIFGVFGYLYLCICLFIFVYLYLSHLVLCQSVLGRALNGMISPCLYSASQQSTTLHRPSCTHLRTSLCPSHLFPRTCVFVCLYLCICILVFVYLYLPHI